MKKEIKLNVDDTFTEPWKRRAQARYIMHITYNSEGPHTLNDCIEAAALATGYSYSTLRQWVSYFKLWRGIPEDLLQLFDPDYPGYLVEEEEKELPRFTDIYERHEVDKGSGLYLLGNTIFNPETGEKFYCLKVGKSTNLQSRIKQYYTHNPFVWVADTINFEAKEISTKEEYCHVKLSEIAISKTMYGDEWYIVNEEWYNKICNEKFGWFFEEA